MKILTQEYKNIHAENFRKIFGHFLIKKDDFHSKLVGNTEPDKPDKPEVPSPSLNISHVSKPDKARARPLGKTVRPSPKISGPDPTLVNASNYLKK